jgi:putative ABC transport system substrate-binding protein
LAARRRGRWRRAQQPTVPVIGWLSSRTAAIDAFVLPTFHRALSAQGFVEGRNVAIVARWADDRYDQLRQWRMNWCAPGWR